MKSIKFLTLTLCLFLSNGIIAQQHSQPNMETVQLQKTTLYTGIEFSELDIDLIGKVVLSYGPVSKLEIECPVGEHASIKAKHKGRKVVVRTNKSDAVSHSTLYVTLESENLKIDALAVGRIESQGPLPMESLELKGTSVGSVALDVEADRLKIEGKAYGDILLSGAANNSKFKIEAINSLDCSALELAGAQVMVKASSDIQLNVSTFLEVNLFACPKISVIGQPMVKVIRKDPQVTIETIN